REIIATASFTRARIQAHLLFVHDENNYLLRINEPDPEGPPPRFFLSRTARGNLWRTRYDLPQTLTAELVKLASEEPITDNLLAPPRYESNYVKLLEQEAPITEEYSGPAYYLNIRTMPDGAVLITQGNAALIEANFPYTMSHLNSHEPVVVVIADDVAVALCRSVRLGAHHAEAGVDTVSTYRGRGYAALVTQGWSAASYVAGRIPLYSTSWDNLASQAVARKAGAIHYASTFSLY
ncbi:MAG: GNAT family N-acetyltransferase, partial [Chloroflexia bacterium]